VFLKRHLDETRASLLFRLAKGAHLDLVFRVWCLVFGVSFCQTPNTKHQTRIMRNTAQRYGTGAGRRPPRRGPTVSSVGAVSARRAAPDGASGPGRGR